VAGAGKAAGTAADREPMHGLTPIERGRQNPVRRAEGRENAMAELPVIARGLRFPEGPVAMADGSVTLGEIAGSAVTRITPNGAKTGLGRGWRAQRPRARSDGPELYAAREPGR
jgi:hypothetical protein